jgi:hypothetical protein
MVKTQIQLPDELYFEVKRVAQEYEMSFAEVVRRSIERTIPAYPRRKSSDWIPPEPLDLGLQQGIEDDEWRLLANEPDYRPRNNTI